MTGSVCCALLLLSGLGLGVSLAAQFGRCAGDLCVFQDSLDFDGARKACASMAGALLTIHVNLTLKSKSLFASSPGLVWLQSSSGRLCTAASITVDGGMRMQSEPCNRELGMFVCQYEAGETCDDLEATGGVLLEYATTTGYILNSSNTFPPGTIALAQQTDSEYPNSKRLCFSNNWLQAPWRCEVLQGGCEHGCSNACACPGGYHVHWNGFSCAPNPRANPECPPGGCLCAPGFTQVPGGRDCVDVNECADEDVCTGAGNECVNTKGSYICMCPDGFDWDDGACVNVTICSLCEHMDCRKYDGVYRCACREGFMVSPRDPTKCVWNCTERDCRASCDSNHGSQCTCQDGYVIDVKNDTYFCTDIDECDGQSMCDHQCENLYGSYRCLCDAGFDLWGESKCVRREVEVEEEVEEEASGSEFPTQISVTAAGLQPAAVPPYVKTGSILGITVFMLLCVVLLALLTRNAIKRCGKFELSTLKHPDLDIYYLQQVTTETYKRLSLDRQLKNDSQRM